VKWGNVWGKMSVRRGEGRVRERERERERNND
jgi:hypothetical protein